MEYNPPSETLPIFDSTVFRNRNTSLTFEEASKYFLEYPTAQGTENLKATNIGGALVCSSTASFGTVGSAANIPTCIADYSTILPADSSTKIPTTQWVQTAITAGGGIAPLVPDPSGTYTNSTVQVNNKGQVISASSGAAPVGGYVVPPVFVSSSTMVAMTQYNLDIPIGTRQCVFTVVGGGGAKGTDVLVGDTMYAGGMGGSGAYGRVSITASDDALIGFPAFQYQFVPNATNPTTTGGGMNLMWSPSAIALYGQPIVGNYGGRIMSASGGAGGTNAVAGTAGTGGLGGLAILGGTGSFTIQSIGGSAGNSPPAGGFTYSTANNSYRGGQNANADIMLDGNTVSSACDGASANYVNGRTFPYGGLNDYSKGGIYIEYFY